MCLLDMNYIRLFLRRKLLQPLKELLIGFTREAARVVAQNTEPGDCGCPWSRGF